MFKDKLRSKEIKGRMTSVPVNSDQVSGHGEGVWKGGMMGVWGSLLCPIDRGQEM